MLGSWTTHRLHQEGSTCDFDGRQCKVGEVKKHRNWLIPECWLTSVGVAFWASVFEWGEVNQTEPSTKTLARPPPREFAALARSNNARAYSHFSTYLSGTAVSRTSSRKCAPRKRAGNLRHLRQIAVLPRSVHASARFTARKESSGSQFVDHNNAISLCVNRCA